MPICKQLHEKYCITIQLKLIKILFGTIHTHLRNNVLLGISKDNGKKYVQSV